MSMRSLFIIPIVLLSLVSLPSWGDTVNIECKNKLTNEFIEEFPKFHLQQCDKLGEGEVDGKYFATCTYAKHALMQIKSCQIQRDAGLLDWSHMQFINIPEFNQSLGVAYQYAIPCWQFGSHTSIKEKTYVVKNNLMELVEKDSTNFYLDLNTMKAGYAKKRDYECVIK